MLLSNTTQQPPFVLFLGLIHGGIGGCHQGLGIVGMRGIHRNPQAGVSPGA